MSDRTGVMQTEEVGPRQTAAHQHAAAGGSNVRIIGRAARDGQIQIADFRKSPDAGRTSAPPRRATRSRKISGMKKPPLNRIASGTAFNSGRP